MTLTPQHILRQRILTVLGEFEGNRASRAQVLEALGARFSDLWTEEDRESPQQRPFEAKWRNRASFERADMVRAGLLEAKAGRGVWMLSQDGRRAASISLTPPSDVVPRWDMEPGDCLSRLDRQATFGGGVDSRVELSDATADIFVYARQNFVSGGDSGYDGWSEDRTIFLFAGEGLEGDQQLDSTNGVLLRHRQDGRDVRVFVAESATEGVEDAVQRYLGQFELDPELPFVRAEASDRVGVVRTVIIFRLRPIGVVLQQDSDSSPVDDVGDSTDLIEESTSDVPSAVAAAVDLEQIGTQSFIASGHGHVESERREAQLVAQYQAWLEMSGHEVGRYRIRPSGQIQSMFTDLYDHTSETLYEAKASSARDSVRLAIGQLFDYRRFIPEVQEIGVLLPSVPSEDVLTLLSELGIRCVVRMEDSEFVTF